MLMSKLSAVICLLLNHLHPFGNPLLSFGMKNIPHIQTEKLSIICGIVKYWNLVYNGYYIIKDTSLV